MSDDAPPITPTAIPATPLQLAPARQAGDVLDPATKEQAQGYLEAARSDATRRAYQDAALHFLQMPGARLPANEAMVIAYLVRHAGQLNPRTLALRLSGLAEWHRLQGFANPCAGPEVRRILTGIARTHARPKRKARALEAEHLDQMVAALASQDTLTALRDAALLQVGYYGCMRRSELVNIDVEHLDWSSSGVVVQIPRSKTDQTGEGQRKAIPCQDAQGPHCPVRALRRWLEAAGIHHGPVFRSINQWGQLGAGRLHAGSVNDILSRTAELIALPYAPLLASHSLRRGLATSAHRAGAPFDLIKKQGGWRSDSTVWAYIDEAGEFERNAAGIVMRRSKPLAAPEPSEANPPASPSQP